ncbi:outer membrane beta-barrel protein [Sphingobacterium faecium]|uniref:outer membrane beta-barrel protein n=1 Tax=Sphingobacterium faecium TaxID=34087 RepID=UPI0024684771|nr:outer membrane beta-barrel protein [Sphingobacterium faecium]MDH5825822.1 outer membrane beta-barrel protein [Sphingobacterium faecium]
MNKFYFFIFLLVQLCFLSLVSAQEFELRGHVADSLQVGVVGAAVRIYTAQDSLSTVTDKRGNFRFRLLPKGNVEIIVSSIGYERYSQDFSYTGGANSYSLPMIVLKTKNQRLQEVVVKAPHAIRLAKDTVEYNASAYTVGEHDRLEDLLRQLPGVSIDAVGNVTTSGQIMTKLRVNGKDFFTNNVKDFLQQLPADIIAKLQVIDDYGDQANFSGIKVGKSQKMLNLVIKDGQSKGVFGSIETTGSTNKSYRAALQSNLWLDIHQLGMNTNYHNNRTEEGRQCSLTGGLNYRLQPNAKDNYYGNYGYTNTNREGVSASYIESVTGKGTLYNRMQNTATNDNQSQQLQLNLQTIKATDFWNLQVSGQVSDGRTATAMQSRQTGAILQDLDNAVQGESMNKSGNLTLSWSRNMQKQGRNLSASFSSTTQADRSKSHIMDQLRFYDQTTGDFLKDSVNMRLVNENKDGYTLGFTVKYTEPLSDYSSQKPKQVLDVGYSYALRNDNQVQETEVQQGGVLRPVDSLSATYGSLFNTQQLDMSYRVESSKMQYSLGVSFLPALMQGDVGKDGESISYNMLNVLPIASMRYLPSLKNAISLNYTGTVTPPAIAQLMPLLDVRNLQQVTIGNPNLKPSKNHGISLILSRTEPMKGNTFNLSFNESIIQNQVVSNVLLLADTLNSFRQETHYLNATGAYNLGASYDMTLTFAKPYQFRWSTLASKNHSIIYVEGTESGNNIVYLSQSLSLSLSKAKLRWTANLNYYDANSTYGFNNTLRSHTYTWEISSDARWTISPRWIVGVYGSYRINGGYTVPIKNPLIMNAYTELYLTAKKDLSLQLQGYDLLAQQQSVYLLATANSVTQRTFNPMGRYVQLTAKFNLSRFGSKN